MFKFVLTYMKDFYHGRFPFLLNLLIIGIVCFLGACGLGMPQLEGFDRELWQSDFKACQQRRVQCSEALLMQKHKLLDCSPRQVRWLLGKPDEVRLYRRGQYFYVYYLTSGWQCDSSRYTQPGRRIELRFSSLDRVNEFVLLE